MSALDVKRHDAAIEQLLPQDVRELRVPWWSFFDQKGLVGHLQRYPGISFRVKGEGQYAIGGHWRGRPEIGLVQEVVGSKNRAALIERMVERYRELDCGAVILSADEANRNSRWFLQQDWQVLDEIVVYTRRDCRLDGLPHPSQPIRGFEQRDIDEILELERAAFPFLWWSGREDFLHYAGQPEVTAVLLLAEGRLAGYASFTLRSRQGYLDRLAVHPEFQRRGFGTQLLYYTFESLGLAGAKTVSLNTQITNYRSQNLYRKYGFVRTNNVERVYGLWLKKQEDLELS